MYSRSFSGLSLLGRTGGGSTRTYIGLLEKFLRLLPEWLSTLLREKDGNPFEEDFCRSGDSRGDREGRGEGGGEEIGVAGAEEADDDDDDEEEDGHFSERSLFLGDEDGDGSFDAVGGKTRTNLGDLGDADRESEKLLLCGERDKSPSFGLCFGVTGFSYWFMES